MGFLDNISKRIRSLDAFPKTMDDFRVQTASGGFVSLISISVIVILVISELIRYLTPERIVELKVDVSRGDYLKVNLDIDFPYINCEVLGVDALDATGNVQLEISNDLMKTRIYPGGRRSPYGLAERKKVVETKTLEPLPDDYCGSCYGAEDNDVLCCKTCEDVVKQYDKRGWVLIDMDDVEQCLRVGNRTNISNKLKPGEGCNLNGFIGVAKVQGNFHISPGHTVDFHGKHMHDMSAFVDSKLDLTHKINHLSFGDAFPGWKNPLDGVEKKASNELGMHEYFVKVVPTTFRGVFGKVIKTNQYSVTEYFRASDPAKGGRFLPGVFIFYDLSPILIEVEERRKSFFHFIVQLCAIVGGVYTVSGMIDSSIYHLPKMLKKNRMGKSI